MKIETKSNFKKNFEVIHSSNENQGIVKSSDSRLTVSDLQISFENTNTGEFIL